MIETFFDMIAIAVGSLVMVIVMFCILTVVDKLAMWFDRHEKWLLVVLFITFWGTFVFLYVITLDFTPNTGWVVVEVLR
mgnify:CR=1 FL=1